MEPENNQLSLVCPLAEISAYIDGELSLEEEFRFEQHLAGCPICSDEINNQKNFLRMLSSSLESCDRIDLPDNFTKTIVANAESRVGGLRKPKERFNAVFICIALFLFVLFALGAEAFTAFNPLGKFVDQSIAVAGLIGNQLYHFAFGVSVILRSFSSQAVVSQVLFAMAASGVVAYFAVRLSRFMLRKIRT